MTGAWVWLLAAATGALGVAFYLADLFRDRRQAVQEERSRLVDRVRVEGIGPAAVIVADRAGRQVARPRRRFLVWSSRHRRCREVADSASRQIWGDRGWSAGALVVLPALAFAWAYLFVLQRDLDVHIMQVLGHDPRMAAVLGTAVAVGIAVCGLLLSGLVGLHDLVPGGHTGRRWVRRTLATSVTVLFILLALALPSIAIYRSQYVLGPDVVRLEKLLAQERSLVPPEQVRIDTALSDLAAARERLTVGQTLDRTLTVVVPVVELATSFAAVYAGVLVLALGAGCVAGFTGWRADAARSRFEGVVRDARSSIVEVAYRAGADLAEAELMARRTLPLAITCGPERDPPLARALQQPP